MTSREQVFQIQQGRNAYKLTGQHKLKLDKIPAETGRCGHEIPTLTKELLSTDSGWVGGDQFSLRIWSLGSTILQWILTHPRIYRQHKLDSVGSIILLKKK